MSKKIPWSQKLRMKLAIKLLAVILLKTLILVILVSVLAYNFTKSYLQNFIMQTQLELAEQSMQQIDTMLYERYLNMLANAGSSYFINLLLNQSDEIKQKALVRIKELRIITGPWHKLIVVDTQGEIIVSSDETLIGTPIALEPHRKIGFEEALKGNVYHSDFFQFRDTSLFAILYAAPIRDMTNPQQPIIGAVIGGFSWEAIEKILEQIKTFAMLVNRQGEIIATNSEKGKLFKKNIRDKPFIQEALRGNKKSIIISAEDSPLEIPSAISYVPQKGQLNYQPNGWSLILATASDSVLTPVSKATARLALILIPVLALVSVILILILSKFIIKPISLLTKTIRLTKAGNLSQLAPVVSRDEIGELAISFNQMVKELKETTVSREWFEVLLASIGDAVISTNTELIVTFMNKEAEMLTGWKSEEVINKKDISQIFKIINFLTKKPIVNPIERILRNVLVTDSNNNTFLQNHNGTEFPIDYSVAPIWSSQHQILGAVLVFREISAKYKRDRELLESEKRFRAVTDSTADAIISINSKGKIIFWNYAAAQIFGYKQEEIIGKELAQLMPEMYRERHKKGLEHYLETGEKKVIGKTVELVGLRKSGEEFPIELTLSVLESAEEIIFTGIIKDISLRKKIEIEKKNLEEETIVASNMVKELLSAAKENNINEEFVLKLQEIYKKLNLE